MLNIFNSVLLRKPKYSKFDLSHDFKLSFQMGRIIPTLNMEILPGDTVNIRAENFLRFAPLVSPVMHKVRVETRYFFVPTRILWPAFERWIAGQSDVEAPYFNVGVGGHVTSIPVGSLGDYLGLPTGTYAQTAEKISSIPFAAYVKIYDEYFRDQNLIAEKWTPLEDGAGSASDYASYAIDKCFRPAWEHDYFTSCLPFAQKGDAVQIPLVEQNPLEVEWQPNDSGTSGWRNNDGTVPIEGTLYNAAGPVPFQRSSAIQGSDDTIMYDPRGSLKVDIQAEATDINSLRRAFRLQEWLERNARGGTRYTELIRSHFGKRSSDARLQRPEYLGGAKQNMVISEVLSTTENEAVGQSLAQMAGHGISVGQSGNIRYSAEEHGYIIGVAVVRPDTAYYQGIHRSWQRFDRLDYAWPTFANIGEQPVLKKELYGTAATGGDQTFGYIPRYAEYKYFPSRIAGEMRTSLDFWHLARKFANQPSLNQDFIECDPDTRIFAVEDPDVDHIYAHIFNHVNAIRPLPKFGIPTI